MPCDVLCTGEVPVLLPLPAPVPVPAPAPVPANAPHVLCSHCAPINAPAGPSMTQSHPAFDGSLDDTSHAYELLVGGSRGPNDLNSANAALFWHSKLLCAEGAAKAANHYAAFICAMCLESLRHCFTVSSKDGSHSKHIKLSVLLLIGKGKGRAALEYDDPKGKGNGRAKPIDEAEDAAGDMD